MKRLLIVCFAFYSLVLLNGCVHFTTLDYGPLLESNPKSILVMMPDDETNDVNAAPAVLASTVLPLSERGYYVFPVSMVTDTFKHNGVNTAHEMKEIPLEKLKEVYGADAVMYLDVKKYDTKYLVLDSVTTVTVKAQLVDINTGKILWDPIEITVNNQDGGSSDLFSKLIGAVVKHVINNVADVGYDMAVKNAYWTYGNDIWEPTEEHFIRYNDLPRGPRSPDYRKDEVLKLYKEQHK